MNELYALDPAAPADTRELKLLLDQFGLQTGRFLPRYPDEWAELLRARLASVSDVERSRLTLLLQRRDKFVPTAAPYPRTRDWDHNAHEAVTRKLFDGVIGATGNKHGWPTPEGVLYDDDKALPPGRGEHVPMQAPRYADCAEPLFRASAEVFLVDPYFTLKTKSGTRDRRRWPVLLALLRRAESVGTCQSLRLVLQRDRVKETHGSEQDLGNELSEALTDSKTTLIELNFELREDVGHGRYLFSIHGGLQFDRGFEEHRTEANHVHWLSGPELAPLLDRFTRPPLQVHR